MKECKHQEYRDVAHHAQTRSIKNVLWSFTTKGGDFRPSSLTILKQELRKRGEL